MAEPPARGEITKEMLARIAGVMRLRKITQRQVAQELGVKDPTVSRWLSGDAPIPADAFVYIARRAGLELKDLDGPAENVSAVVGVDVEPHSEYEELDILAGVGAATSFDDLRDQGEVIDRRRPPEGYEDEIGPNGRGFVVRGESMAGFDPLPLHDGQIVWIGAERQDARRRARGLVVAIVLEAEDSEPKFVVKWYDGERLYSYRAGEGKTVFTVFQILDTASVIVATAPPRRAPRY